MTNSFYDEITNDSSALIEARLRRAKALEKMPIYLLVISIIGIIGTICNNEIVVELVPVLGIVGAVIRIATTIAIGVVLIPGISYAKEYKFSVIGYISIGVC